MSSAKLNVARLIEYIEAKLLHGEYRAGDQLPSVRRLAAKFDLSFSSAYRALTRMAEQGVLLRDSDGSFLAGRLLPSVGSATGTIGVVLAEPYKSSGLIGHVMLGMNDIQHPYKLEITVCHQLHFGQQKLTELGRRYDGLMLLNDYDSELPVFECACPAIGVLMQNTYQGRISVLNLDPIDAARQAVLYFLGLVRRVVVLSSPRQSYKLRGRIFKIFWDEIGAQADIIDGDGGNYNSFEAGTGYFFTSDTLLQDTSQRYFEQFGRTLAEDHIVLGADGKRHCSPEFHRFPTIAINWRELGRLAMQEMLRLIADPLALRRTIMLPGKIEKNQPDQAY